MVNGVTVAACSACAGCSGGRSGAATDDGWPTMEDVGVATCRIRGADVTGFAELDGADDANGADASTLDSSCIVPANV